MYLEFLYRNNHTDLLLLEKIKSAAERTGLRLNGRSKVGGVCRGETSLAGHETAAEPAPQFELGRWIAVPR